MKVWIRAAAVALLAVLLVPAMAKGKKDKNVPAILGTARYVYVEAVDGDQFQPNLIPEDRQAIADVQNALHDWHRYTLTMKREEADILIVVRKGRIASMQGTVGTGGLSAPMPPGQAPRPVPNGGVGVGTEIEAGPPDDLLEVYAMRPDGYKGATLWRREMADGLDGPVVPLMRQLRTLVDREYPPNDQKKP